MGNKVIRPPWSKYENPEGEYADTLRVIGVGLPRTGTSSLKAALDILGFGPCHHMLELIDKPKRIKQFIGAYDGKETDFYELMKGYGSTVDTPTLDFYKQIQQAYPKAKLILTVRDNDEKWFQSYQNTIGSFVESSFNNFALFLIRFLHLHYILACKCEEKMVNEYGEMGPLVHRKHNERIISENIENELLIFNVREGWPRLCEFLEVGIPDGIPFPNINDAETFTRNTQLARIFGVFCWILLIIFILFMIYVILRIM